MYEANKQSAETKSESNGGVKKNETVIVKDNSEEETTENKGHIPRTRTDSDSYSEYFVNFVVLHVRYRSEPLAEFWKLSTFNNATITLKETLIFSKFSITLFGLKSMECLLRTRPQ